MAFAIALLLAGGSFASPALAKDEAKLKTPAAAKEHKPWIKLCPKMPKGNKKKLCVTRADYLDRANMVPYAPIAVEDIDGKKSLVRDAAKYLDCARAAQRSKNRQDTKRCAKGWRQVGDLIGCDRQSR